MRGLHFQAPPCAQTKLIRVLRGHVLDVIVDLRHLSPSYAKHLTVELVEGSSDQLLVPVGFAHGFCTLEDNTEVLYKVDSVYSPEHDRGVNWVDPALGITWPVAISEAVISDRDRALPLLSEAGWKNRMHIFVTGGAGFIGSAVCQQLVRSVGAHVVNIDKLTYAANPQSLQPIAGLPNYAFERVDIGDRSAMDAVFTKYQPIAVLHLAAETHVDRSITGAGAFVDTNIVGTYRLLEAARHYYDRLALDRRERFRFIHVSTDEVYGSLGQDARAHENTPYQPSSPYSASKAASDHLARAWNQTYGLPVIVSNCSNNYGPCQFPEKLIPLTIINALEGKRLPIYGDGSNVRDWLYVEDHAAGLVRLLERGRPGETYNFGGDSERTNLSVVEQICDLLDRLVPTDTPRRSLITFVPDRPGHDLRYSIDASKARRELEWRLRETFESGLDRTIRWYLDNRSWWEPLRHVYRGERLGLLEATG